MPIAADSYCYLCHFRRHTENARALGDDATATAFAKELMRMYLKLPEGASTLVLGEKLSKLYDQYYHLGLDRCAEEKRISNQFVVDRMDAIRSRTEKAPDPVYAGLQGAILGNYIDFSALQGEVSFEKLDQMLTMADEIALDPDVYRQLCADLEKANTLVYLTDNAGEIGFDRILAEQIHKKYPRIAITFCVKGGPVTNDATRQDAQAVGIPFPVMDTGAALAGALWEEISPEAKRALSDADLVISKGQANVESLYGCGLNIYYAFLIKCQRFIDLFQKPKLTPMLIKDIK